jgi:phosphoribosylglycinamide formyltransferase 1
MGGRVAVLASGSGTNLKALLDHPAVGVVLVVSDRGDAGARRRAREAGVEAVHLDPTGFGSREDHDSALVGLLEDRGIDLVCLAGYMRILSPAFVRHFAGRLLNVHPSLLPAFPGLYAQRQALEHGVRITGATVHFVDEGLDSGPIVLQAAVTVRPDDTEATLAQRILAEEHRLYPEAVRLFAEGRLRIAGRRVHVAEAGEGS